MTNISFFHHEICEDIFIVRWFVSCDGRPTFNVPGSHSPLIHDMHIKTLPLALRRFYGRALPVDYDRSLWVTLGDLIDLVISRDLT